MSPSETPAPSGITWEMAMNNAAVILSEASRPITASLEHG